MVRVSVPALLVALIVTLAAPAFAAQDRPAPSPKSPAPAAAVVNLNTATAAQIATLPGIGEKAAQRIIEYREKNGGFKKPEELMNVKGIGEKSFLKLKALITVTDPKAAKQ
jgi:competence protein ComEA